MQIKKVSKELRDIGISNSETRKSIIRSFSGFGVGNETQKEADLNQKRIFNILMSENSEIRHFFMENIGLSDDTLISLNEHLSKNDYYDTKGLFQSLRLFIINHFKNIDLVIYRFNSHKNTLEFFTGLDDYATNISIDDTVGDDFKHEIEALSSEDKNNFFLTLPSNEDNYYGGLGAIKIKTINNSYVFSFHLKNNVEITSLEDADNEILKIKKIFQKYGLISILDNIIKYINAKYKDDLTGMFNKTYINALPKHIRYSVLFLDLNRFKIVNDTYGHAAGDEVLKEVASILKDSTRSMDKVCRISGDEFIILIPTNNPKEIESIKDRIEKSLEKKVFMFKNINTGAEEEVRVSISIGKGYSKDNLKTLQELIKVADENMYSNKDGLGYIGRIITSIKGSSLDEIELILQESGVCDFRCRQKKD